MDLTDKKIIDYCDGTLPEAERKLFEAEMEANEALHQEVLKQQEIHLAIQSQKLVNTWKNITDKSSSRPKTRSRRFFLSAISVAAAVALFLVIQPFIRTSNSPSLEDIFYPDPGLVTPMSSVSEYDFYDGMVEYKMGHYDKALSKWSGASTKISQDTVQYYRAMANMQLGNLPLATQLLQSVQTSYPDLEQKINWYLVYLLLKQDRTDEAKDIFSRISTSYPNYDQLKNYLESLER